MSKERLEEIKTSTWNICKCETCNCGNFTPNMAAVEPVHFDWLIEQAERAQELEKQSNLDLEQIDKLQEHLQDVREALGRRQEQNKRYREAIEFGVEYLRNSDIRQVQLVVTALKGALENEE